MARIESSLYRTFIEVIRTSSHSANVKLNNVDEDVLIDPEIAVIVEVQWNIVLNPREWQWGERSSIALTKYVLEITSYGFVQRKVWKRLKC